MMLINAETSAGGEERLESEDIAFLSGGREIFRKKQSKSAEKNIGGNRISAYFISELVDFFKFCTSKSIKMGKLIGVEEFDENYCVGALRLARKGIASQMKKLSELEKGTWAGGRSTPPENDSLTRVSNLQIELLVAQKAKSDIKALKIKLMLMVDKMRAEQDIRLRHSEDMQAIKKKLLMLTDHTEKLMNHLRIEATTKLRIVEHLRVSERSNRRLVDKASLTTRKSSAKDRLILELREGTEGGRNLCRRSDSGY